MKKYDYIFLGAGCAGLSLLTRMIAAGLTAGKNVLLIDRAPKQQNDRTWCFWEDQPDFFEPVVCRQWDQVWFHANQFSKRYAIAPYNYKMIRGIDFYRFCFASIEQQPNIEVVYGEIAGVFPVGDHLQLTLAGQARSFTGAVVFNSLWSEATVRQQQSIYLLQHFKGWMIETPQPFFNPAEATLMDFRVSQANGTTFLYVLPLSANKALVEYTLFSDKVLPDEEYNTGLSHYLQHFLQLKEYTIAEEEFGVIPMTNASFPWYANGMYHIGTAGGQTKSSSGYTFRFIQKQSAAIVQQLQHGTLNAKAQPAAAPKRFKFYDAVLLRVLADQYASGSHIFTTLFKKNTAQAIFSFLDNESSFASDLSIISSLPFLPFLSAATKQIMKG